jgi:hypothetical protein
VRREQDDAPEALTGQRPDDVTDDPGERPIGQRQRAREREVSIRSSRSAPRKRRVDPRSPARGHRRAVHRFRAAGAVRAARTRPTPSRPYPGQPQSRLSPPATTLRPARPSRSHAPLVDFSDERTPQQGGLPATAPTSTRLRSGQLCERVDTAVARPSPSRVRLPDDFLGDKSITPAGHARRSRPVLAHDRLAGRGVSNAHHGYATRSAQIHFAAGAPPESLASAPTKLEASDDAAGGAARRFCGFSRRRAQLCGVLSVLVPGPGSWHG